MTDTTDIAAAITDVRRAYRIVWAYQRRVLDAIEAVTTEFSETRHYWWQTNGYELLPRNQTTDPLNKPAWNFLPLYNFTILRNSEYGDDAYLPKPGRWILEITHEADNGWKDCEDRKKVEPNAAEFSPADSAVSALSVCLWRCDREAGHGWWGGAWDAVDGFLGDGEVGEYDVPHVDKAAGLTGVGITLDVASIETAEDATLLARKIRRLGREKLGLQI